MAGEIGHASVEPNGLRCNCGAYGCLETVAAGPAIALQASQAVAAGQDTRLQTAEPITAKSVYEAARLNDSVARQIVQKASAYLARAVQWLFMTYDVDQLVIGGGVSHDSDDFLQPILDELHRMRAQSDLLNLLLDDRKVALLPNDYNAGVWGAIALAMQHTSA
jgi:predicted NBD/HSP70 family sugar kinase